MDNDRRKIFLKNICLIASICSCLFLLSSCSEEPQMIYNEDDEERACQYTYETYDEFISNKKGYHQGTNVITIEDEKVSDDEILIDVISNVDNAIVAINYGGSYDDESIKMYSPVTNFKLNKGGIYYLAINIDRGYGSDNSSTSGWVGISKCFEKGKHYVVFYGDEINIEERYGK